jgi:hypothetical protein
MLITFLQERQFKGKNVPQRIFTHTQSQQQTTANRLTAEEAAFEPHLIDSNHRAENGRYTINQPMNQAKDQPLATEPLQLCTNHKPNTKSAVIEKRDVSVSTVVADQNNFSNNIQH